MYLAFDFLLSSQPLHLFLVRRLCLIWFKQLFLLTNINIVIFSESLYYIFQPCVGYFSLLLKEQCVSWLFWTKYFKKKFNYSCFIFPLFYKHFFSPGLPSATCLLEISCLEKITVFVIDTMLVALPLIQMKKVRREVTQQIKYKSR